MEIFWKILKNDHYYNVSGFDHNTSVSDFAEDMWEWNDLGSVEFIMKIEEIFVISKGITEEELTNIKTFGELADLLIQKAKDEGSVKNLVAHNSR